MINSHKLERVFITLFLTLALLSPGFSYQPDNRLLELPVTNLRINNLTIAEALSELAVTYKVPVGLEEVVSEEPDPKIDFTLASGTIQDVINAIVTADERYRWEIDGGVISVFPRLKQESLLDIQVSKCVINSKSRLKIKEAITELPEIKEAMETMQVQSLNLALDSGDIKAKVLNSSINLSDVSFRTILNEIAKKSRNHYWVVSRIGNKKEFLIINL